MTDQNKAAPAAPQAVGVGEVRNASDQIISDAMENGSLYVDHDNECIAWNGPGFAATVIGALKDCGFHVVSGHNFAQGEALATREEATVGAGEWTVGQRFPELNEHLTRMSLTGNTGSRTEWVAFRDCLRSAIRARSSALEAHDVLALCRAISDDYQTSETHHPDHVLVRKDQFDALVSILNRQPEAREGEAVAWMRLTAGQVTDLTCIEQPGYRPLYFAPPTHPAAPSDERLQIAVEASGFLLDRLSDLEQDVNERDFYGHVHPAASRLRKALAALQAEQGAK